VTIDQKEMEWLKNIIKPILEKLGHKATFYRFKTGEDYFKWRVTTYSKHLFKLFKEIKKDSVGFVEKLRKRELMNFIAGFFDAEGSITDRINIYNKDIDLLYFIKKVSEAK